MLKWLLHQALCSRGSSFHPLCWWLEGPASFGGSAARRKAWGESKGGLGLKRVHFRKDFIEMYLLDNNDKPFDFPYI